MLEKEEHLGLFPWVFIDLMIRAFELVTCRFALVTCGFELLIRGFEIVARRFELGTRNFVFQLVLLSFQLLFLSFQLVTLNSCLTISPSFLVQTWHFYHKMVATTFSSQRSYSTHQVRCYQFFIVEIIVESVNLIQMSK